MVFAIFVGFVIAAVIVIDLMYGPNPPIERQGGQRVLPGEGELLPEMPLPPEPPLEDEALSDLHECRTIELFTKVEEYRNDFPDAG